MRNFLFVANISLLAILVLSGLFTGLTYSSMENYDSNDTVANDVEPSRFMAPASVREPTVISKGERNSAPYKETGTRDDREGSTSNFFFQIIGVGGQSQSGLVNVIEDTPSVNVTVWCYDINGVPLYLANVMILHHDWGYPIYSGFTNSSGVFEAISISGGIVDVCVSWGNASAPGEPGYHMYLSGVDATSSVEVVVNAQDLRVGGGLAKVTLTLQNSTGSPMLDTRLFMGFNASDGRGFPLGMGPITDSGGVVMLYLSNDTWSPNPTYYAFLVCQMTPSNNTLLILTDRLVSSDEDVTLTTPSPSELGTVNLAFSSPGGISLIRDIRLFFEFPQGPEAYLIPPEIHDDLALMYLPSKLHGKMLFAIPLGTIGALFLPVMDDGSTRLCVSASMPFGIAAIYTNTTSVSGGPWLYLPMRMFGPLSPGHVEHISMGGAYLKLRSVTPIEAYLGSEPKLSANFTDEFYSPLVWIVGDGSTSIPTGMPGVLSHLAVYNLTIWYPQGDVWYDGQAMVYDPYGGSNLNGILSGVPTFPSLDRLGTYAYNVSIDTGPWPLNPPGTPGEPLTGSFEVIEPPALATLDLDKNLNVWTEEDALPSGSHTLDQTDFGIRIHNEDDYTDTILGDLRFYIEAENITWVGWEEYADWSSSYANWTFPPEFVIHENEGFGTDFSIKHPETVPLNVTISRWMNQTTFSFDGYQLVKFRVNYANTEFIRSWGHIGAQEGREVNASFVPGTFQTDAPLEWYHEDTHWIHFNLHKEEIQTGLDYNFSVIVKVELTGEVAPPILYKPHFGVGCAVSEEFMLGGEDYMAEMPPEMLPDYVSIAQASTNTSNLWNLERRDQVGSFLGEVSKPAGARATFWLDENFGIGTEDDIMVDGDYQLSPSYGLGVHNEDDDTDTILGDLGFYVEAENITWVGWEEHAEWDVNYANWTFPPEFVIHENEGFGTDFGVEQPETVRLNVTIGRWMNQTTFSYDGYQLVKFGAIYTNTEFLWSWGHIGANERWEVNASIVPGTFQTDAPLEWYYEDTHRIDFGLDKDSIQAGVIYNFFVVVKVEPTAGHTIVYKPDFSIGRGFYHQTAVGPEGYITEMPLEMLPDNVMVARVQTNSSNHWLLERRNHIGAALHEFTAVVKQTFVLFNINPNPATTGDTITLKGILVDENGNPLGNENVKLYARPLAGSWRYITSLATNDQGFFMWQTTIPEVPTGTYVFAVYYPGSEAYKSTYNLAILIIQPPS
jgi:hypothetical protein